MATLVGLGPRFDGLLDRGPVGPDREILGDADPDVLRRFVGPGQAEPVLGHLLVEPELGHEILFARRGREDLPQPRLGDRNPELGVLTGQVGKGELVIVQAPEADGPGQKRRRRARAERVKGDAFRAAPDQVHPRVLHDLGGHQGAGLVDEAQSPGIVVGRGQVEDAADDRPAEQRRPRPVLVGPVVGVLGPEREAEAERQPGSQDGQMEAPHGPSVICDSSRSRQAGRRTSPRTFRLPKTGDIC